MPKSFVAETHKYIAAAGNGDWIDVYQNARTETGSFVVYAGLVPEGKVGQISKTDSWPFEPSRMRPGCTKYADGNVVYNRFGDDQGYEPLILERSFHGIKPPYEEVSEEFRLFHNLYFDRKNNKHIKITDDGSEHNVIRTSDGCISVRAPEIKQFLAIKEMRLAILFDIRRFFPDPLQKYGLSREALHTDGPDFSYTSVIADLDSDNRSFVRVYGKKLIVGFEKRDSDFWPYNEHDDEPREYMKFIVGLDERGKEIQLPCDPNGGNYLRPVFFRPDVLNRYHENPSKYSVEDGYLRCAALWGVQIDNDNPEYVTVFLGDIGRDIPEAEHGYWRSFNIAPAGRTLSETAFRRSFLAEFADPNKADLAFKHEFTKFQENWKKKHGWQLFKPLTEGDEHCFSSLRIPATDEQNEFDTQVMYLTKVLVDSLNEAEIAKQIPPAPNQKGISKLEEYLKIKGGPDQDKHIQFLRDLQSLRSTGAAHRKGSNYDRAAQKLGLTDRDPRVVYAELLGNAVSLLNALRSIG